MCYGRCPRGRGLHWMSVAPNGDVAVDALESVLWASLADPDRGVDFEAVDGSLVGRCCPLEDRWQDLVREIREHLALHRLEREIGRHAGLKANVDLPVDGRKGRILFRVFTETHEEQTAHRARVDNPGGVRDLNLSLHTAHIERTMHVRHDEVSLDRGRRKLD